MDVGKLQSKQELNYEEIIRDFNQKIKNILKSTSLQEREDLEQEIKIKILEKIDLLNHINCPGFFDYINNKK